MEEFSSLLFSRPSGCWFVFLCVCVVLMCSLSRPHMWGICSDVLRSWNVSSASVQWRRRHKRWALPQTPGSLHCLQTLPNAEIPTGCLPQRAHWSDFLLHLIAGSIFFFMHKRFKKNVLFHKKWTGKDVLTMFNFRIIKSAICSVQVIDVASVMVRRWWPTSIVGLCTTLKSTSPQPWTIPDWPRESRTSSLRHGAWTLLRPKSCLHSTCPTSPENTSAPTCMRRLRWHSNLNYLNIKRREELGSTQQRTFCIFVILILLYKSQTCFSCWLFVFVSEGEDSWAL